MGTAANGSQGDAVTWVCPGAVPKCTVAMAWTLNLWSWQAQLLGVPCSWCGSLLFVHTAAPAAGVGFPAMEFNLVDTLRQPCARLAAARAGQCEDVRSRQCRLLLWAAAVGHPTHVRCISWASPYSHRQCKRRPFCWSAAAANCVQRVALVFEFGAVLMCSLLMALFAA